MLRSLFAALVMPVLSMVAAGNPPAPVVPLTDCGERYYMTVFGTESVPLRARYTHTFAVFTRTALTPGGEVVVASDTVSWLPASLLIRPLALRPEPGVNLTLRQTFDWLATFDGRVAVWGPYEIGPDRYSSALARRADLESGRFEYRALGGFTRSAPVSNCGQSFSRAGPVVGRRYLQPTPLPGITGTSQLVNRYLRAGAFLDPDTSRTDLLPAIGVPAYPLTPMRAGERVRFLAH